MMTFDLASYETGLTNQSELFRIVTLLLNFLMTSTTLHCTYGLTGTNNRPYFDNFWAAYLKKINLCKNCCGYYLGNFCT